MAGHGSPPPPDRAWSRLGRSIGTWLHKESYVSKVGDEAVVHSVQEYRPPPGTSGLRSDAGTRFRWSMAPGGDEFHGRVATTRPWKRAQVAVARSGERYAAKKDRFTGR